METFKEYVIRRKEEIKQQLIQVTIKPKLVIINVGDDPASQVYIKGKLADCAEVGITVELIHYGADIDETVLYDKIKELNNDSSVTGFIVQLPLPKKFNEDTVISLIDPKKDVDGFSKLAITDPATPTGIIDYLEAQKFDFTNKNAVVIGRSNIVGKPIARLLLEKNCNVTVLHSKTLEDNKRLFLKNADLIITAVGKRGLIDETYELKPTAWIIDVGMNRDENGKLIGDCERNLSFYPIAFQSPVPGGVGLTTRLALITNLLKLYSLTIYDKPFT